MMMPFSIFICLREITELYAIRQNRLFAVIVPSVCFRGKSKTLAISRGATL